LINALKTMNTKKLYKELVFYLEACEAGSMFDGLLPNDIKIYASTGASPDESGYFTYCPGEYGGDIVNGTEVGTCLGCQYSCNFLENLDVADLKKETLQQQFLLLQNETNLSHPQQYGDLSITKDPIGDFEGPDKSVHVRRSHINDEHEKLKKTQSALSLRDGRLHRLQRKHEKYNTVETSTELLAELKSRRRFDTISNVLRASLSLDVNAPVKNIDFECLKGRMSMFKTMCGKFSDYGLQYAKYLHYSCVQGADMYAFEAALVDACYNFA